MKHVLVLVGRGLPLPPGARFICTHQFIFTAGIEWLYLEDSDLSVLQHIIKGFIDRLHFNIDILVIFISLFFVRFFMRRKSVMRSVVIIIP